MGSVLIILNDGPYGTERAYNGLRLAASLAHREGVAVNVFLIGDGAACARRGQKVPQCQATPSLTKLSDCYFYESGT